MKINVVSDHRGLHGSLINTLDFTQYLQDVEGYEVLFHCNDAEGLRNTINKTFRDYRMQYTTIKELILSSKDVVVTDFKSLVTMYLDGKRIVAGRIVVFDNLELSLFLNDNKNAYFYPEIDMDELLDWHKHSEIIFLMPLCNKKIFEVKYPHLECHEFYKKLYVPKLDEIQVTNNGKLFYRVNNFYDLPTIQEEDISAVVESVYPNSVGLTIKKGYEVFQYRGYIYTKKQETNYCEQFGRLIFEFLILGKKVFWFHNPYTYNDGLHDYLKHYGTNGIYIREKMLEPYKEKYWKK